MQICWDQNKKSSDQVKEKPGNRYADADADGDRDASGGSLGVFDRG
jgi:hypothetical protein